MAEEPQPQLVQTTLEHMIVEAHHKPEEKLPVAQPAPEVKEEPKKKKRQSSNRKEARKKAAEEFLKKYEGLEERKAKKDMLERLNSRKTEEPKVKRVRKGKKEHSRKSKEDEEPARSTSSKKRSVKSN